MLPAPSRPDCVTHRRLTRKLWSYLATTCPYLPGLRARQLSACCKKRCSDARRVGSSLAAASHTPLRGQLPTATRAWAVWAVVWQLRHTLLCGDICRQPLVLDAQPKHDRLLAAAAPTMRHCVPSATHAVPCGTVLCAKPHKSNECQSLPTLTPLPSRQLCTQRHPRRTVWYTAACQAPQVQPGTGQP